MVAGETVTAVLVASAVPATRNTKLPDYAVTGAVPPGQVNVRPNLDVLEKLG